MSRKVTQNNIIVNFDVFLIKTVKFAITNAIITLAIYFTTNSQKNITMKQVFIFLIVTTLLLITSCSKEYDDAELNGRVDNLENRVSKLEESCLRLNTNIASLQTIVNAIQNNDYVTGVTPISESGSTIGYTITFVKAEPITIYHGRDEYGAAEAAVSTISVMQDSDSIYYWTHDGVWMLDNKGNKLKAEGTQIPKFKIEKEYWYISYNEGTSWTRLGKATGHESYIKFQNVTQDENNVYFTLADGATITAPRGMALNIVFDESDLMVMTPNSSRDIGYTVTSGTDSICMEVTSSADIKAKIIGDEKDFLKGKIHITTGETIDEYSKVIVFVSNGNKVIMRSIRFEKPGLKIEENTTKTINAEGGKIALEFLSNVECLAFIPDSVKSWISIAPATRALRKQIITLNIEPNKGYQRSATITVQSADSTLKLEYLIEQKRHSNPEGIPNNEIWYTSTDNNVVIPYKYDVFDATIISNVHDKKTNKGIITFDNSVTKIGVEAFSTCKNLQSIIFPDKVSEIGDYALSHCTNLKRVTICGNVTSIGNQAFDCCENLQDITIPESVKRIGWGAFSYCKSLQSITIPDSVTIIENDLFAFCEKLQKVTMSNKVTSIGSAAFLHCDILRSITIPESVTEIGSGAFRSTDMRSITIPENVTEISNCILAACPNLKEIKGKFTTDDRRSLIVNGKLNSFAPSGVTEYIIPQGVTTIGIDVFRFCDNLQNVIIPEGVTTIEEGAFFNCKGLQSVTIPKSVTTIGKEAFHACDVLKEFKGGAASEDGRCLIIDNVLKRVAPFKLSRCILPDDIISIGESAFSYCTSLRSIVIPETVTNINDGAFEYCYNLQNVTMGNNVTSIGATAFYCCESLRSITIPAHTVSIGRNAFCNCNNLKKIYCKAITPPIGNEFMFEENANDRKIYVPNGSLNKYKTAPNWSDYSVYILGENTTDLDYYISTDYSTDGKVTTMQTATKGNGIDIVLMGDAYSDRQIADGTYENDMKNLYNNLFTEEPYKSFIDHFNVYYVNAVSATEGYDYDNTAISGYFDEMTLVGGNDNAVFKYAQKAIGNERIDEALLIVAMNSDTYAGTCYMYYPEKNTGYGNGVSVSYFTKGSNTETFAQLLHHEACGHGFAKLADEYAYEYMGAAPIHYADNIQMEQRSLGWWKNIDFTSNSSKIRWSHFIKDARYTNEKLGAYEGGATYLYGVWRPTEHSIMRYNTGDFNAPSREAIYYRIHKLAYGDNWEYNYEKFVEWDAINRSQSAISKRKKNHMPANYKPLHPPVIISKSWRDTK